jgi:hypothetical protein
VTLPEQRPDARSRRAILFKYGHYFHVWDGALKTSFRYYWDDWAIRAYTLDLVYDQHLFSKWIVTPQLRLYSQGSASFFAYEFAVPQTFMSSDYRLSAFDNILGGLSVAYRLPHDLTVSLGATYQAQVGRDRVAPIVTNPELGIPAGPVSAADMTTLTGTFGLSWRY